MRKVQKTRSEDPKEEKNSDFHHFLLLKLQQQILYKFTTVSNA